MDSEKRKFAPQNCPQCKFMGHYDGHDLWFHPSPAGSCIIIVRYDGGEVEWIGRPPDHLGKDKHGNAILEAYRRAKENGILSELVQPTTQPIQPTQPTSVDYSDPASVDAVIKYYFREIPTTFRSKLFDLLGVKDKPKKQREEAVDVEKLTEDFSSVMKNIKRVKKP